MRTLFLLSDKAISLNVVVKTKFEWMRPTTHGLYFFVSFKFNPVPHNVASKHVAAKQEFVILFQCRQRLLQ